MPLMTYEIKLLAFYIQQSKHNREWVLREAQANGQTSYPLIAAYRTIDTLLDGPQSGQPEGTNPCP